MSRGGRIVIEDRSENGVAEFAAAAPVGQVFKCSGTHSIVSCADLPAGRAEAARVRREARSRLVDDINAGTEPCTLPDCDVCEED